eukprot:Seg18.3 transcript_id=Seg18.3/GoldUCD/mRNA.D3Y31 product="hypothetical protein" protein_id=Seg18.3/GoldUCD/D3Y31
MNLPLFVFSITSFTFGISSSISIPEQWRDAATEQNGDAKMGHEMEFIKLAVVNEDGARVANAGVDKGAKNGGLISGKLVDNDNEEESTKRDSEYRGDHAKSRNTVVNEGESYAAKDQHEETEERSDAGVDPGLTSGKLGDSEYEGDEVRSGNAVVDEGESYAAKDKHEDTEERRDAGVDPGLTSGKLGDSEYEGDETRSGNAVVDEGESYAAKDKHEDTEERSDAGVDPGLTSGKLGDSEYEGDETRSGNPVVDEGESYAAKDKHEDTEERSDAGVDPDVISSKLADREYEGDIDRSGNAIVHEDESYVTKDKRKDTEERGDVFIEPGLTSGKLVDSEYKVGEARSGNAAVDVGESYAANFKYEETKERGDAGVDLDVTSGRLIHNEYEEDEVRLENAVVDEGESYAAKDKHEDTEEGGDVGVDPGLTSGKLVDREYEVGEARSGNAVVDEGESYAAKDKHEDTEERSDAGVDPDVISGKLVDREYEVGEARSGNPVVDEGESYAAKEKHEDTEERSDAGVDPDVISGKLVDREYEVGEARSGNAVVDEGESYAAKDKHEDTEERSDAGVDPDVISGKLVDREYEVGEARSGNAVVDEGESYAAKDKHEDTEERSDAGVDPDVISGKLVDREYEVGEARSGNAVVDEGESYAAKGKHEDTEERSDVGIDPDVPFGKFRDNKYEEDTAASKNIQFNEQLNYAKSNKNAIPEETGDVHMDSNVTFERYDEEDTAQVKALVVDTGVSHNEKTKREETEEMGNEDIESIQQHQMIASEGKRLKRFIDSEKEHALKGNEIGSEEENDPGITSEHRDKRQSFGWLDGKLKENGMIGSRKVRRSNGDESLDRLDNYEADPDPQFGRLTDYDDDVNEDLVMSHSKNRVSKRHHVKVSSPEYYDDSDKVTNPTKKHSRFHGHHVKHHKRKKGTPHRKRLLKNARHARLKQNQINIPINLARPTMKPGVGTEEKWVGPKFAAWIARHRNNGYTPLPQQKRTNFNRKPAIESSRPNSTRNPGPSGVPGKQRKNPDSNPGGNSNDQMRRQSPENMQGDQHELQSRNYGSTTKKAQNTKKSMPMMYMGIKNTAYAAESSCDESSPFLTSNTECDSEYDDESTHGTNRLMHWSKHAAKEIAAKITKSAKGIDFGNPFKASSVDSQDRFIVVDTTSTTNFLKESISLPERVQLPIRNGRSYFDSSQLPCKSSDDELSVENTYYKLTASKQITKRDLDRLENKIHSFDKQNDIEGSSSVSDDSIELFQRKTSSESMHVNNEQIRVIRSNEILQREAKADQFQTGKMENNRRAAESQYHEDKNIFPTNMMSKGKERDKILTKRQEQVDKSTKLHPSLGMLNTKRKSESNFSGYTKKARTLLEDLDSAEKGVYMKSSKGSNECYSENKEFSLKGNEEDSTSRVPQKLQKIPRPDAAFRFSLKQYSDKDIYITVPEVARKELKNNNAVIENQNSLMANEARSQNRHEPLLSGQPSKTDFANESSMPSEFSSDSSKSSNVLTNLESLGPNDLSADIRKYLVDYSDYNPRQFIPTKYQQRSIDRCKRLFQVDRKFNQDWEEIMAPYVSPQLILGSNISILTDALEQSSSGSGNRESTNPTSYAETVDPSSSSLNSISEPNVKEKGDILWTASKSVAQANNSQLDVDVALDTEAVTPEISNNLTNVKRKTIPKQIATDATSMHYDANGLDANNASNALASANNESKIGSSSTQKCDSDAETTILTNDAMTSPALSSKKTVQSEKHSDSAFLVSPRVANLKEALVSVSQCPSSPSLLIATPVDTSRNSSSSTISINCSSFGDTNDPSKEFVLTRDIAIKEASSKLEGDKQKGLSRALLHHFGLKISPSRGSSKHLRRSMSDSGITLLSSSRASTITSQQEPSKSELSVEMSIHDPKVRIKNEAAIYREDSVDSARSDKGMQTLHSGNITKKKWKFAKNLFRVKKKTQEGESSIESIDTLHSSRMKSKKNLFFRKNEKQIVKVVN